MPRPQPFQFETLLRIRKRQEDLRAMDVATALRDLRAAVQQRANIEQEQQRALTRWGTQLAGQLDVDDARRYHQYERHLARLIDDKDAQIQRLERLLTRKRSDLIEASKKKQIVEKLKERRNAAHAFFLRREDQRASDETATNYAAVARQQETLASDHTRPGE